jgi:hypothetical protein
VRKIAGRLRRLSANGDLSKKITVDVQGEILENERHDQHDGATSFHRSRRK